MRFSFESPSPSTSVSSHDPFGDPSSSNFEVDDEPKTGESLGRNEGDSVVITIDNDDNCGIHNSPPIVDEHLEQHLPSASRLSTQSSLIPTGSNCSYTSDSSSCQQIFLDSPPCTLTTGRPLDELIDIYISNKSHSHLLTKLSDKVYVSGNNHFISSRIYNCL